jgi:CheY-like chemotaxis protein
LIAEDNLVNQQLLSALLDEKGITYEIANDGLEAIDKFKNDKFDLVFMDMNMLNMDGIEATKKIKEYEKENFLEHTSIVMLTANAMTGDKEKFLEVADGYLAKPIDSNELLVIERS